jgi:aryl-alcohol dehydrogenase-like predicted oxidoreductase
MNHSEERRQALKMMGLTGSALLLESALSFAGPTQTMMQRTIYSTGEKLPVVGLGSWQQFDVGTSSEERSPLIGVLKKMHELGGRIIDASPMYGRAEQVIGDLSSELNLNDQFFLASKVWTTGRQHGIDQMTETMARMGRKKIDLMQVHNLQDYPTHILTLRDWKHQGKTKYIGVTHYVDSAHPQLEEIVKSKAVDFAQFNYSIRSRNAEKSLLPAALDHGVAVVINEPFDQGALFRKVKGKSLPPWAAEYGMESWAQFFLKYIISHPAVTCVIPGTSDVMHVEDNMKAGFGRMPDPVTRKKMVTWLENI